MVLINLIFRDCLFIKVKLYTFNGYFPLNSAVEHLQRFCKYAHFALYANMFCICMGTYLEQIDLSFCLDFLLNIHSKQFRSLIF